MSPPPTEPPSRTEKQWVERSLERQINSKLETLEEQYTDGLRELKDSAGRELEKLGRAVERIEAGLLDRPKEARIYLIIGGAAIAVLLFVMAIANNRANDAKEILKVQQEVGELKREAFEKTILQAIEAAKLTQQVETRAMQDVVLKRKPSPVLEQPVLPPPAAPDAGTPENGPP